MGLTLIQGRDFTEAEGWSRTPYARHQPDHGQAILAEGRFDGRRFRLGYPDEKDNWFTVIGIVTDVNLYGIDPENPSAADGGVRAVRVPADAQHRVHDSGGGGAGQHHGQRPARNPRVRSEPARLSGADR